MSDAGYVRIYRALLGHPVFRNDAEAMTFAWMIVRASWRPTRVRYKGQPIALDRGELCISLRDLAEAMDRDKMWISRLLKRLKNETMIDTRTETAATIITICNYDEFQGDRDSGETATKTRPDTQARQGRDTEQRREKGKKEESSGAKAPSQPADEKPPLSSFDIQPTNDDDAEAAQAEADRLAAEEAEKAKPAKPKRAKRPAPAPFELPAWLPGAQWDGFIAMRKRKDADPTPRAIELLLGKLERLRSDGHDPGAVLDQSTMNNWTDIYLIKAPKRSNSNDHFASQGEYSNPLFAVAAEREAARSAEEWGQSGDWSEVS